MHQNIRGGSCSCHEVTHTLSESPKPDTRVRKREKKTKSGWLAELTAPADSHAAFHTPTSRFSQTSHTATPAPCHAVEPSFLTGCTILVHSHAPEPSCCASGHPLHNAFAAAHTSCALLCFPKALRQPARASRQNCVRWCWPLTAAAHLPPMTCLQYAYTGRMAQHDSACS